MANTYHQLYIHIVFSVKNRECLIPKDKKENLHKYITGIVKKKNCKLIAVNSMPDHIHIFVGLNPTISIANLVKDIKLSTNKLITENQWVKKTFKWQDGYGAFSYSKSHIEKVYNYILNQEKHHKKQTFKEEYINLLNEYGLQYDKKFVFDLE